MGSDICAEGQDLAALAAAFRRIGSEVSATSGSFDAIAITEQQTGSQRAAVAIVSAADACAAAAKSLGAECVDLGRVTSLVFETLKEEDARVASDLRSVAGNVAESVASWGRR
ncbi:MAG: hypothetical protein ACRCYU_15315 [Nocardioides sp.]